MWKLKNEETVKFVPTPRVWKLKNEETVRLFNHGMAARNDDVTKADDIQKKWLLMKETRHKSSKYVCGMTKGPPRYRQTWWYGCTSGNGCTSPDIWWSSSRVRSGNLRSYEYDSFSRCELTRDRKPAETNSTVRTFNMVE